MLNTLNGDYRKDMLSSHYDYLQFSYYKREYIYSYKYGAIAKRIDRF